MSQPLRATVPPQPPPAPGPTAWWPRCVICYVIVGRRAAKAITLIGGDAVCGDHVKLRADCETLGLAIREARADLDRTT